MKLRFPKISKKVRVKVAYPIGTIENARLPLSDSFKVDGSSLSDGWFFTFKPYHFWEEKRPLLGKRKFLVIGFKNLQPLSWKDNPDQLDNFSLFYTQKEATEIFKKMNEKAKSQGKPFKTTWLYALLGSNIITLLVILYFAERMGLIRI